MQARLPTIAAYKEFVESGALMAYGVDLSQLYRGIARYIDRILQGANPSELPYQLPTKFELVVNLKTAKALGITTPSSVLLRADRIIE